MILYVLYVLLYIILYIIYKLLIKNTYKLTYKFEISIININKNILLLFYIKFRFKKTYYIKKKFYLYKLEERCKGHL